MRGDSIRLTATTSGGDSCSHSTSIPNLFAGYLYKCSWKLNLYEKTVCASSARRAVKVSLSNQCVCDLCGSEANDHTSIKKKAQRCALCMWYEFKTGSKRWRGIELQLYYRLLTARSGNHQNILRINTGSSQGREFVPACIIKNGTIYNIQPYVVKWGQLGCSRNRGYFVVLRLQMKKSYMSTYSWHA